LPPPHPHPHPHPRAVPVSICLCPAAVPPARVAAWGQVRVVHFSSVVPARALPRSSPPLLALPSPPAGEQHSSSTYRYRSRHVRRGHPWRRPPPRRRAATSARARLTPTRALGRRRRRRTWSGPPRCRPTTPPVGSLTPGTPRRYTRPTDRRCIVFLFVRVVRARVWDVVQDLNLIRVFGSLWRWDAAAPDGGGGGRGRGGGAVRDASAVPRVVPPRVLRDARVNGHGERWTLLPRPFCFQCSSRFLVLQLKCEIPCWVWFYAECALPDSRAGGGGGSEEQEEELWRPLWRLHFRKVLFHLLHPCALHCQFLSSFRLVY
jgi:hypothetical protein